VGKVLVVVGVIVAGIGLIIMAGVPLGRLPGDFTLRWRGREVQVPLASSLVLSLLAMLVGLLV